MVDWEGRLYSYHAEMCKVFSHPKRLELIQALRDGEMSVAHLCRRLKLSPANMSQHLAMMRERRLVVSRKQGNVVYYRLANPKLLLAFDTLREVLTDQIQKDAALLETTPSQVVRPASSGGGAT